MPTQASLLVSRRKRSISDLAISLVRRASEVFKSPRQMSLYTVFWLMPSISAVSFTENARRGGFPSPSGTVMIRSCDILSYDPRRPVSFPHNGRTLTDDVADVFFSMYANRNVTDQVGPHRDLLDEFPYLGPPHSIESNSHNVTSGGKHGKQG